MKLSASMLAASSLHLYDEVCAVSQAGADAIHWDIMDHTFVPYSSFSMETLVRCREIKGGWSPPPFDVHFMVNDVTPYMPWLTLELAHAVTLHPEAAAAPLQILDAFNARHLQVKLAIQTLEDIPRWSELWPHVAGALVLAVAPGRCGQTFNLSALEVLEALRQQLPHLHRSIDGGITLETGALALRAGAETLVTGSFLFQSPSYAETISAFKALSTSDS